MAPSGFSDGELASSPGSFASQERSQVRGSPSTLTNGASEFPIRTIALTGELASVITNGKPNGVPKEKPSEVAAVSMLQAATTNSVTSDPPPNVYQKRTKDTIRAWKQAEARRNALPISSLRTGLCYDVRMRYHATIDPEDIHPEDPRRIHEIYKALAGAGLVDDPKALGTKGANDLLCRINARQVKKEEALLVHNPSHWREIEATQWMDAEALQKATDLGDSVYYNKQSFMCSKLSCGGAIETCRAVWLGQVRNAIAVVRPPGHHAEPHKPMGFCLLNNVAVATRVLQKEYSECRKILILDWDVHHGNGTQTAFYKDKNVLYMSLHRYDDGRFYPSSPEAEADHCGEGDGIGMNVNIPWQTGGMYDGDYLYAFQKVIMPIAYEFDPDLVIISAGFDAAAGDRIGDCFVTPAGYAHMTHMLMSLADGKVVVCLEGGYNLNAISESALAVTQTLMGEPPAAVHNAYACASAVEVVNEVIAKQSKYWQCMQYNSVIRRINQKKINPERLHGDSADVIRRYQADQLRTRFRMINLAIRKPSTSPSFDEQLMATVGYEKAKTLVFILREPPEVLGIPEHGTDALKLHNSFLMDPAINYIRWAIKQGYAVADLNIPLYITPPHDIGELINIKTSQARRSADEVILYVWDNYIDLSDAENVILIGIGEGHRAMVSLLGIRDCTEKVVCSLSFLCEHDLQPLSTVRDENLGPWYKNLSQVYICNNNALYNADKKKLKAKYGAVQRTMEESLSESLAGNLKRATEYIAEKVE